MVNELFHRQAATVRVQGGDSVASPGPKIRIGAVLQ